MILSEQPYPFEYKLKFLNPVIKLKFLNPVIKLKFLNPAMFNIDCTYPFFQCVFRLFDPNFMPTYK